MKTTTFGHLKMRNVPPPSIVNIIVFTEEFTAVATPRAAYP
jgi:hypothetical protein